FIENLLVVGTCLLLQASAQYETLIIHVIPVLVLLMFLHLAEEKLLCYLTLFSQVCLFRCNAKEPQGKYMHLASVHDGDLFVNTCLQEITMHTYAIPFTFFFCSDAYSQDTCNTSCLSLLCACGSPKP
ncbi:hypothetical protein ACQCP9_26260, partial [Ralstonia pseudosolanacearum]|uniref:hypothetical protein n=1 Tax=Ralstonia pseudosolanacearum TaxID=1310165 RepID=UPI003CF3E688